MQTSRYEFSMSHCLKRWISLLKVEDSTRKKSGVTVFAGDGTGAGVSGKNDMREYGYFSRWAILHNLPGLVYPGWECLHL